MDEQVEMSSGHPIPEGSELCDPLDALTWKLVHAFGATVSVEQWLAARELLVQFQPEGGAFDLDALTDHQGLSLAEAAANYISGYARGIQDAAEVAVETDPNAHDIAARIRELNSRVTAPPDRRT